VQLIGRSARQSARNCDRAGRQRCDLTRRLQAFGIDVLRRDYDVSDPELLGLRRVQRVPHDQELERAALAHQARRQQARGRFRDQAEADERR